MTTRQALHTLIDALPEELLPPVEHALQQLAPLDDEAFDATLAAAPVEDEDLSPREKAALVALAELRARLAN